MKKIRAIVLVVLLALVAYGLYRTNRPFVAIRSIIAPLGAIRAESLVDRSSLTTAQALAQLPNSPTEQKLAQEALRLADHEVDLAFAAALKEAAENPPLLSPQAKKIQDRLARAQKALDFHTTQVALIAAAVAKANGSKKDTLNNNLSLMKAQMELDQDEVDDAKEDLIRAGGDPQARIRQMVEEHDAAARNTPNATAAAPAAAGKGLISLYRNWSALYQKEKQLLAAQQAAAALVAKISALHDALEAKVDAAEANHKAAAAEPGQTNGEDPESATLLKTTRGLSDARKALSSYDKRIDNQTELAQVYGNWLLLVGAKQRRVIHGGLIGLAIVLGILLVGLFFGDWFGRLLGKTSLERRQVETLRAVTRVTLRVVAVLLILLVVFGTPSQLGTFLGLAGAGLTVALKDFIVGFIGWLVLMGKNGIRLGDWVEINGVTGEVVELGMFHTVLLETGNWTDSGHPTGRRVTFTNSFAIEGHYFNFSTSGQWLWDELQVVLPAGKDPYPIVDAIQKKVAEATAQSADQAQQEWKRAAGSRDLSWLTAAPSINVKPVLGGVEIAVRYITRANERYGLRAKLYQAAVDLLGQRPAA